MGNVRLGLARPEHRLATAADRRAGGPHVAERDDVQARDERTVDGVLGGSVFAAGRPAEDARIEVQLDRLGVQTQDPSGRSDRGPACTGA